MQFNPSDRNFSESSSVPLASRELQELLDGTFDRLIIKDSVETALPDLMHGLWALRRATHRDGWHQLVRQGRAHPLHAILLQDPMTEWAFTRPRGYPGDAVLLDHSYEVGALVAGRLKNATVLGKRIYRWLVTYSGVTGLKERRRFMATILDETAATSPHPCVLSLACGHGRELALSRAALDGEVSFTGLDQDAESLRTLIADYGSEKVTTEVCAVRDLLKMPGRFSGFDLVFSIGLFDYLPDSVAQCVLRVMIGMVKPGGRIIIANGLQGVLDAGYIEMFMDWHLVYRTEEQMPLLLTRMDASPIINWKVFSQPSRHFVYMDMTKTA